MNSVFGRSVLGFAVTTAVVIILVSVSMWGIEKFGGGAWWAQLVVLIVGLVSTTGLYGTFLHDPLKRWVNEPELRNKFEVTDAWVRHAVAEEFAKNWENATKEAPSRRR